MTIWAVFTISFFIVRAAPGGPFDEERDPPADVKRAIEQRYNLDAPLWVQYLDQLGGWLLLDPGPSLRQPDHDVASILAAGLPVSLLLGGLALILGTTVGILLGVLAAYRVGSWLDHGVVVIASIGISLPLYVIAGILVLSISFGLGWLPPAGWQSASSLILPVLCLSLAPAAQAARLVRSGLVEMATEEFARTAYAKGNGSFSVLIRHCLRPALIPLISTLGPTAAALLTGSLVIEQIFAIPGVGMHFIQGAMNRDYPLVLGAVLLYTVLLQVLTLLGDLLLLTIDPRLREQDR
ncbi:MAG: ABC transporter permease [Planctomycetota bacterium]|nr:ABC transporter permease [Planctomycetota bacterium]